MSGCHVPDLPVSPMVEQMQKLEERIKKLEEHKNYQIDENRKISRRVDELEIELNIVRALGSRAYHPKKPHKCPICKGTTFCKEGMCCAPCDGTGIIWG